MGSARELFERFIDAESRGDFQALALMWSTDAVRIDPMQTLRGRDAIVDFYRRSRGTTPDTHFVVDNIVEEGERLAWEVVMTGTNTGPVYLPTGRILPPTGRRLELRMAGMSHVRNGQCERLRVYFDQVDLRRQLGFSPTPAPAIGGMLRGLWATRVSPRLRDRVGR